MGGEIEGTTQGGTTFPRAIVAMYAALRRLKGKDTMPKWLGVDDDYWIRGEGMSERDAILVRNWTTRFQARDDEDEDERDWEPGSGGHHDR